MPNSTANANANLARLVNPVQVRLWSVKPLEDGTGGTEFTAGVGGYTRQTQAIGAQSNRARASTAAVTYTATADWAARVEAFSWHESDGGEFYGSAYFRSSLPPVAVTASGNTFTSTAAHGFANGDRLSLHVVYGGAVPTGVSENRRYFVINATSTTFQLSLTAGGSAIVLSNSGSGLIFAWYIQAHEVLNGSTFELSTAQMVFPNS